MQNKIFIPEIECLSGVITQIIYTDAQSNFYVIEIDIKEKELEIVTGIASDLKIGDEIECFGHWVNDKKRGLQFQASVLAKQSKQLLNISAQEIENLMIFFKTAGISTRKAQTIFNIYGQDTITIIRENPFQLIDVGVSFKVIEALANHLNYPNNSPQRALAGILYLLDQWCEQGHCAMPYEQLIALAQKKFSLSVEMIEKAVQQAIQDQKIVCELIQTVPYLYPKNLHEAEVAIEGHLKRLKAQALPWENLNIEKRILEMEQRAEAALSNSQQIAIRTILSSKVVIITGGPGVGKTTLIKTLLLILRSEFLNIALCAPTGRSAKRISETTQMEAKTIHRLLQFDPKSQTFKYNAENPLQLDLLVIDEASMVDIVLLNHLLSALPTHAAVVFVGDVDQLASVGSGAVLNDLITSEQIETVRLTEIFRQAESSRIITNANRINQGEMLLPNCIPSDFYTMYAETVEETHNLLLQVVCQRLPQYMRCEPIKDIQVLTPMNRTGLGTYALNAALQQRLNNRAESKITRLGSTFSPGDKVIQIVNNYEKDVYNGDIGIIDRIDVDKGRIIVYFDGIMKQYEVHELDELSLAYAISIHKSQGSEFPIVVIPLVMQHYLLLARNVLYTAVTRGKQMVVLIGQKKAIDRAIANNTQSKRITNLASRLRSSDE